MACELTCGPTAPLSAGLASAEPAGLASAEPAGFAEAEAAGLADSGAAALAAGGADPAAFPAGLETAPDVAVEGAGAPPPHAASSSTRPASAGPVFVQLRGVAINERP